MVSIRVVLPDPFGSDHGDPVGAAEVGVDPGAVAEHHVVQQQHVASRRYRGAPQVDPDHVVVADQLLGLAPAVLRASATSPS